MKNNDLWLIVGMSIFLLIGGGILFLGIRNVSRAIASRHWPQTPGVVAQSSGSSEHVRDSDRRGSSTMYSADIRFQYQVAGREYSTSILHFGQTEGSGNSADAALREFRYPAGAPVTIAYDPKDPTIAAAEPGYDSDVLLLPGAGLAFIVPGVMAIMLFLGAERGTSLFALGLAIFGGIFATFGLVLSSIAAVNLSRAHESETWPKTQGVIVYGQIDSSVHYTETHDGEFIKSNTSGAHLVFRYEVGGRQHYSNVRTFGELAADSGDTASRVSRRYPLGSGVTVSYSPEDPDLGTLEPGIANEAWWLPGAGAAFLLFGLAVIIFGIPALTSCP